MNAESTSHWWLWAGKILALLYLGRLAALLTRIDALPPSAGRLLLLAVVMPLCVWWAATGWLVLGGDAGTTDARMRLVRAIYWAIATLATVGYGDIVATTIPQMLYACCIMISGVAFFGYILSNIATLMLRLDAAKQHQEEMRDRVEYFMRYHAVPPALRQRVRAYFKYLWSSRHGYDDVEVFESLPRNLRADLALHLHRDLLAKVPVLKDASPEVIRDLVITLRPMVCVPGDIVCRKGAAGDEMYFIVHGEVEVLDDNDGVLARLHDGDFFGEMALLTDNPRNATARTASFCDLYVLARDSFKQVAVRYPCSTHRSTKSAKPPLDLDPADRALGSIADRSHASCRARNSASVWRRRLARTRAQPAKILMPTRAGAHHFVEAVACDDVESVSDVASASAERGLRSRKAMSPKKCPRPKESQGTKLPGCRSQIHPPKPRPSRLSDLSRAGKRLMGFCRTNLFKRLESCGQAFVQSVERHILRNYIFLHAIENDLPIPIGTQDSGMLDAAY